MDARKIITVIDEHDASRRRRETGRGGFEFSRQTFRTFYREVGDVDTRLTKRWNALAWDVLSYPLLGHGGVELRQIGDQFRIFEQSKTVAAIRENRDAASRLGFH